MTLSGTAIWMFGPGLQASPDRPGDGGAGELPRRRASESEYERAS